MAEHLILTQACVGSSPAGFIMDTLSAIGYLILLLLVMWIVMYTAARILRCLGLTVIDTVRNAKTMLKAYPSKSFWWKVKVVTQIAVYLLWRYAVANWNYVFQLGYPETTRITLLWKPTDKIEPEMIHFVDTSSRYPY